MDIRFARRLLRRSPGFALLAILMMALGIGANTAVFSVVNAGLMRPLAYRDPDRIVVIASSSEKRDTPNRLSKQVSMLNARDFHDQSTLFEALSYYGTRQTSVILEGAAEYARVTDVSPEFFGVFHIQPAAGRSFSTDETKPGSRGAILISDSCWRTHYDGTSAAIGRTIKLSSKSTEM